MPTLLKRLSLILFCLSLNACSSFLYGLNYEEVINDEELVQLGITELPKGVLPDVRDEMYATSERDHQDILAEGYVFIGKLGNDTKKIDQQGIVELGAKKGADLVRIASIFSHTKTYTSQEPVYGYGRNGSRYILYYNTVTRSYDVYNNDVRFYVRAERLPEAYSTYQPPVQQVSLPPNPPAQPSRPGQWTDPDSLDLHVNPALSIFNDVEQHYDDSHQGAIGFGWQHILDVDLVKQPLSKDRLHEISLKNGSDLAVLYKHKAEDKIPYAVRFYKRAPYNPGLVLKQISELNDQGTLTKFPRIMALIEGCPAEKAGFETGDAILRANNQRVDTLAELKAILETQPMGARSEFSVIRADGSGPVKITVMEPCR